MRKVDLGRGGPWKSLFMQALRLTDHLAHMIEDPAWTFGGGTVLMLRLDHRMSKDIDLFVPDPQYLGHVSPRLSPAAEGLTDDYVEAAEFIKLNLPGGEIDIVVGQSLTADPFEVVAFEGRTIRVETNAEIIAKKFYHRGNRAKARDLFDLCAVADADPSAILLAAPFLERHAAAFLGQLQENRLYLEDEFRLIDRLAYRRSFAECAELARSILLAPSG